jgi:membrane protein YdbS with pleckstrin-like domain
MSNNNKQKSTSSPSGLGFSGVLLIVFVVLKLCGVINWSWIWVLSPLWISIVLVIVVIFGTATVLAIKDKK